MGQITNKAKGIYCKHLEDQLPKISNQSISGFPTDRIELYSEGWFKRALNEVTPEDIEAKLLRFGLVAELVELIMLRYVENKSVDEIIRQHGWKDRNSVNYHIRTTLKVLRMGDFNLP